MAYQTFLQAKAAAEQTGRQRSEDAYRNQQRNALMGAGQQFAAGDLSGASNALAGAGMLDDALSVSRYATGRQEAEQDRRFDAIAAVAQGLRRLPADQRWQAYERQGLAGLRAHGVGDDIIGMITPEMMADADLDSVITMYGGDVEDPRVLQGQRGAIDIYDPYSRAISNIRPAGPEEAPTGYRWGPEGILVAIQGGPADPGPAGALAAAKRAPTRGRSGGGGRSSGGANRGAARPAAPAGRPWERQW